MRLLEEEEYDCVIKGEKKNLQTDLLGSSRLEGVTGPFYIKFEKRRHDQKLGAFKFSYCTCDILFKIPVSTQLSDSGCASLSGGFISRAVDASRFTPFTLFCALK